MHDSRMKGIWQHKKPHVGLFLSPASLDLMMPRRQNWVCRVIAADASDFQAELYDALME